MALADRLKIDGKALTEAMKADWIDTEIARTRTLAQELGISGTPAFLVGDQLVPGALNADVLKGLVERARAK